MRTMLGMWWCDMQHGAAGAAGAAGVAFSRCIPLYKRTFFFPKKARLVYLLFSLFFS